MAIVPSHGKHYVPLPFSTLMESGSPVSKIFLDDLGQTPHWDLESLIENMNSIKNAITSLPLTGDVTIHKHQPCLKISRSSNTENNWKFHTPTFPYCKPYTPTNKLLCHVEENNTFILKENPYMKQVRMCILCL
jgi:hypothetical protein